MTEPLVFLSYSSEDEDLKDQLVAQLGVLDRAGLLDVWSTDQIGAGADWQLEITRAIGEAKVAILLISANFLNSDFILNDQVPALLQRRERAGLVILPLIAKACPWPQVDWLARLVGDPKQVMPIWRGTNSQADEKLAIVADTVARVVAGQPVDLRAMYAAIAAVGHPHALQIGTLAVPMFPLLLGVVVLLALLGFTFYRTLTPPVPPTPTSLQTSLFNVLVADVGEIDSEAQLRPSATGRRISERIFEGLKLEFENLPLELRQDFLPEVWHDRLRPLPNGQQIGLIADETAAATVAQATKADIVIFGYLVPAGETVTYIPQVYAASLRGEADEIVGSEQFGSAIDLPAMALEDQAAARALQARVGDRTKALSRFTLGLMYDLTGDHDEALEVFEEALTSLDLEEIGSQAVFNYFAGRSALFNQDVQAAQRYFEAALGPNRDYPRAYLGLGGIYFTQAKALTGTVRLASPDLQQAIENYQAALEAPSLSPLNQTAARLALGQTYGLKAQALVQTGSFDEANRWLELAIQELELTLDPLETARQYRYLAQAYQSLGLAYLLQAYSFRVQDEVRTSISLYEQASQAFNRCIQQRPRAPFDETLARDIIKNGCEKQKQSADQALTELRGEG